MKKYYVVNSIRGFLIEEFDILNQTGDIVIVYNKANSFEKVNRTKKILHRIALAKPLDWLGILQVVKDNSPEAYENLISYNRFVNTDKPYFIVLENPYGLVNYSDSRMKYSQTKAKLNNLFHKPNLKGIICISKTCFETFPMVYDLPKNIKMYQCYPVIPDGQLFKKYDGMINCIFIASSFYLKGGNDVIEAYKRLLKYGYNNVSLTIITPLERLEELTIAEINRLGISLVDYKLTKSEIKKQYDKAHVILNPTKMDSFSLVVLESMKYGCVYIGTNLYAIPEMIKIDVNGFLTSSKYSPWDSNNLFIHKKHALLRKYEKNQDFDGEVVNFLCEKLVYLIKNPEKLKQMNEDAFKRSMSDAFSMESTRQKMMHILA